MDDEGFLYLLGRSSELIISGGVNVYPAEIEAALIGHPSVADVAVVGRSDADRGEIPHAYVEAAEGVLAGPELEAELLARCRERLANFKLPRGFTFVDELAARSQRQAAQAQTPRAGLKPSPGCAELVWDVA